MSRDPDVTEPTVTAPTFDLANRPGFLIRHLHQIHLTLFLEKCAGNVTFVQYSTTSAVLAHPHLEQALLSTGETAPRRPMSWPGGRGAA